MLEKFGQGYHKFVNSSGPFFLSCRDPTNFFESSQATMTIKTKSGRSTVTPQEYCNFVSKMQPDLFSSLAYDLPWSQTRKRAKVSVDVSLKWLDQILTLNPNLKNSVFGVIQGAGNEIERKRSVQETISRGVFGFALGSFDLDETPEQSDAMLAQLVKEIPSNKPILINTMGDPLSIIRLVHKGIDLFSTVFPDTATDLGCALCWDLNLKNDQRPHKDLIMISLKDTTFELDKSPLVHGCPCWTCQTHTKAYIFHLLNTHEMLAETLLQLHNLYHYLTFFRIIQEQIRNGSFDSYRERLVALLQKV